MSISPSFAGTPRFDVRAELGQGAMGTVYRAYDRELDQAVALKTMRRLGPAEALQLKAEFRARAGIAHPGLVQLYELFVSDELCFFTMELVEGKHLMRWIRGELAITAAAAADSSLFGSTLGDVGESGTQLVVPAQRGLEASALASGAPPRDAEAPAPRPPATSWSRLRGALAALVQALHALHEAGRVHRDVKPANVMVTPSDRVVLFDFGLVKELAPAHPDDGRMQPISGTPAYMAPEQALRAPATRAADLYAVGVILYEALTGALPFSGDVATVLHNKVHLAPRPAHELAPDAPGDLADLAMDLLARSPAQRPTAEPCVSRLLQRHTHLGPIDRASRAPPGAPRRPFVGRADEIAALTSALDEVAAQRRHVTVRLHGPSGIGKSTLVRQFLASLGRDRARLVLEGRCHPQESVPYKALDAVVDAMARFLDSLSPGEVGELVPANAHALLRIFPVLAKFPSFRRAPAPTAPPDAVELRAQGERALRELIARVADRRELILWIEDVQWGDVDSALLLQELLRAPAPPFLLVLTYRSDERETSELLRSLSAEHAEGAGPHVRTIALGALGPGEIADLARSFLHGAGQGLEGAGQGLERQLHAVVTHAEGNPFIAGEMARYLAARDGAGAVPEHLDAARVVLDRIRALDPEPLALLEVTAVAGAPVERSVALAAAGLEERWRPLAAQLRDANLLREISAGEGTAVAMYHDRIREVLLGAMPDGDRRARHRGIAEALTARGSDDFDALLAHWEGAGDRDRAGQYALRAADRAAAALAFDNAAALYEKSLDLLGRGADRAVLLEKLADALASRGRAPEAAGRYLDAAAALGAGAPHRVSDLKRRAAEQYLKSGRFDQGWREMRAVLEELGVAMPGSARGTVVAATVRRVAFLLRPVDVERRTFAPAPPDEQHRRDVLWSASTSWAIVNYTLADLFRLMHLRRTMTSGTASDLCRALAYEASMEVHVGGRFFNENARKLLEKVERLAQRTGDPYDRAWQDLALANVSYTSGRWRETAEACARADDVFRERCPGSAWERVTVAIFHHQALAMLGELTQLRARLAALQKDAALRGDAHASCEVYVNEPVLAWLADDQADEARERATKALAAQSAPTKRWPEDAYRRQHFADLIACVYAAAYRGDPWPAWREVLAQWPAIDGAFLLPLRITGLVLRHARARAALAAAATLPERGGPLPAGADRRWTKHALIEDARVQERILAKDPAGCAAPLAGLVRAGIARLRGEDDAARRELVRAVAGFDREEMALYREAARYALGELRGGAPGAGLVRQAEAWMEAQGVQRPRALVAAMTPGVVPARG